MKGYSGFTPFGPRNDGKKITVIVSERSERGNLVVLPGDFF
jgi:hypothetical protein